MGVAGRIDMSVLASVIDAAVLIPIGAAAVAAYSVGSARAARGTHTLERELMRRRRREEPAAMLVVEGRYAASAGPALGTSMRLTDTVEWRMRRGQVRMRAILDEEGLDRDTVERRLAAASDGELRAGWATFPEDGFTVSTLEAVARERLSPIYAAIPMHHSTAGRARLETVEQGAAS